MLLNDKTILVTGAGRGIGFNIVKSALREGANVVAHVGRSASNNDLFNTEQVLELAGDLSNDAHIDKLWLDASSWKGRIDVLVNNAGVYIGSPLEPKAEWDAGWEQNMSINLNAPAALCRHAIKHNQQTGEGIIINMASRSSHRGDDQDHLAYGAAKAGLLALSKGIARSYSSTKTIAYAIAPAWVRTEMAEAHIQQTGESSITSALPMQEITPTSDVAEMVVFLASGRSRHANGCTIDITGADYVR